MPEETELVAIAATVVSAYVAKNLVPPPQVPALIREIHGALRALARQAPNNREPVLPAVPPRRSVAPGHVVCLVCGIKLKSLRRHLGRRHGLDPSQYRLRFGLAHDHPIVAPAYAAARARLAIGMGLGRLRVPRS